MFSIDSARGHETVSGPLVWPDERGSKVSEVNMVGCFYRLVLVSPCHDLAIRLQIVHSVTRVRPTLRESSWTAVGPSSAPTC